ncbi:hypothetical protein CR983_00030 [Candidatus Saccharibacteria bacterium]|nr:MAG: hypothetical protein CR983_00030 [Candidatus Saccharibacteria bacterium]
MKQVWFFHGGTSFSTYDAYLADLKSSPIDYERLRPRSMWSDQAASQLPDCDVLFANMPNKQNAQFDEWCIRFEKFIPLFGDDVQLVGHSLGAMFLAKYLHNHPLASPVRRVVLIAPGYDDDSVEDLGSFGITSTGNVPQSADEIHFFHSQDDPVVPFSELAKFQADLPDAASHIFNDRGHFLDPEFPELFALLRQ